MNPTINLVCNVHDENRIDSWKDLLKYKTSSNITILKEGFSAYNEKNEYLLVTFSDSDDTIYFTEHSNKDIERIIKEAQSNSIYYYFEFSDGFGLEAFKILLEDIHSTITSPDCFFRDDSTFNIYSINFFYNQCKNQPYFWLDESFKGSAEIYK